MTTGDLEWHSVQPSWNAKLGEKLGFPQVLSNLPEKAQPERLRPDPGIRVEAEDSLGRDELADRRKNELTRTFLAIVRHRCVRVY